MSSASVTNVIGDLLDEDLVLEVGTVESDGGRPRVLLKMNPDFGVVVGVDVGETGIRVEGFDLSMREIAGATVGVHPQEHDAVVVVEHISAALNRLRTHLEGAGNRILG